MPHTGSRERGTWVPSQVAKQGDVELLQMWKDRDLKRSPAEKVAACLSLSRPVPTDCGLLPGDRKWEVINQQWRLYCVTLYYIIIIANQYE